MINSNVEMCFANMERDTFHGLGGTSGVCHTRKATPEEIAEMNARVKEHQKIWGKPPKVSFIDIAIKEGPRTTYKRPEHDKVLGMMRDGKLTFDEIVQVTGVTEAYARNIAYRNKLWHYLSRNSLLRKKWEERQHGQA